MKIIKWAILSVAAIYFLVISLGVVIYQEGNPVPIGVAVTKLILSNEKYVKASNSPEKWLLWEGEIFDFLEDQGYNDFAGGGILLPDGGKYLKNTNEFIYAEAHMLSRWFTVVDCEKYTYLTKFPKDRNDLSNLLNKSNIEWAYYKDKVFVHPKDYEKAKRLLKQD